MADPDGNEFCVLPPRIARRLRPAPQAASVSAAGSPRNGPPWT